MRARDRDGRVTLKRDGRYGELEEFHGRDKGRIRAVRREERTETKERRKK